MQTQTDALGEMSSAVSSREARLTNPENLLLSIWRRNSRRAPVSIIGDAAAAGGPLSARYFPGTTTSRLSSEQANFQVRGFVGADRSRQLVLETMGKHSSEAITAALMAQ